MTFPELNHRWLVPASEITMVFGIIALCQPWSDFLHRYGVVIILAGLIAFSVLTKLRAPTSRDEDPA
ncbi:hypothetical protein [Amaricoccus sp.]|uniref:hypothetical protein n=1 Tax=Amaricoccus sp. TaxID=1872485 RepID=UPI00261AB91C|nr:hypothetical protein [uncultured Amaricoccus sp.]